jgi:hypothetical protein
MTINLNNKFNGKMGKSVKCNGSVGNASMYAVLIRAGRTNITWKVFQMTKPSLYSLNEHLGAYNFNFLYGFRLTANEQLLRNISHFYITCANQDAKYAAITDIYGGISIGQAIIFCNVRFQRFVKQVCH